LKWERKQVQPANARGKLTCLCEATSIESRGVLTEEQEFSQEEKRVLDLLARGLSGEFPNPQRVGCPGPAILKSIALHKLPLSEAEPWLDHLSSCSPCFREFSEIRKEASQRKRTQMWLAAAATVLLAVTGWVWVRSRPSGQTAAVVILDLRGRAALRGENPPESSQPLLEVPRNARNLNVELPIGSNEGAYDVALFNQSGTELIRTSATAKLADHVVVLRADVDLAGVSPGSYFLGLRQPGLEWTRFPIRVL
jgi:hypothetical protein